MNPNHDRNVSPLMDNSKGLLSEEAVNDIQLAMRNEPEVQKLARSIDEHDIIQILEYGKEPAVEISRFSDQILAVMRTNNVKQFGQLLLQLGRVMERFDINDFEKNSGGLISKLFKKREKMLDRLYSKYQSIGIEMEQIYVKISEYQSEMAETATMLERLYEQNIQYYLLLEKYVAAAELKLNELKTNKLPQLEQNALNGDQIFSLELDSLRNAIELLEHRIFDLGMARIIALQTAPQLRLLQGGNAKLIGKINSAFITTIPIFKKGLIQAVAAKRQKLAAESMKELDRRTNEMMVHNARNIAGQSIEVARLSGSPGIKIETIQECFNIILKGMQETKTIEEENRRLREEGEQRLKELQKNFKNSKQK
ncbi:toxic anion resistance protein [Bacillus sp. ISL-45]|uniref:toxic anion resistance protein n=1 Tax=Bacillus sp. ISL-45 TaxID=2819128 RepID=UPI001BE55A8E|nr:toxic anion resistance protein [Bacillus sp. ISL-45]MBT2662388.1 toxic anion resistance protein [Bacillus sp. ISL-45]